MSKKYYLCDIVDAEKCTGCTNCVKHCPTEAIRVRKGTAKTIEERCINCGTCIRICPYHAKMAITDPLDLQRLREFRYTVALCSSVVYSQFRRVLPPGQVLNAIKSLGFDDVFQESVGADALTIAVNELLKSKKLEKPVISNSCPSIIKLIQILFPSLIANVSPLLPPMEIAAKMVRDKVSRSKNIPADQIGIFLITPCTAKTTAIKHPVGMDKSSIDGAISLIHLYGNLNSIIGAVPVDQNLSKSSGAAVGWARSGGETMAVGAPSYLVADGLNNVINLFEEADMDHFPDVDYIECQACHGGCIGGPLTIENPFVARIITRNLAKTLPQISTEDIQNYKKLYHEGYFHFDKDIEVQPVMPLDKDIAKAIKLVGEADEILKQLPGLDCSSCGCPSCRALAEDISKGTATLTDCIFILLKTIRNSAQETMNLIQKDHRIAAKERRKNNETC